MTFSCPDYDWPQVVGAAKRFGADALEPRVDTRHRHGIELAATPQQRRTNRDLAAEAGIEICCLATGCRYADPEKAQAQVDLTRRFVDLAADVGCHRLRVFGGEFPANVTRQQAADSLVKSLTALAPHAHSRDVTLCLETHDAWTNPRDVSEVMRRVNHPAVAVNWDVLHPWRTSGWSLDDAFDLLRPWVRHVHVHDGSADLSRLQLFPIGNGGVDHRRLVQLLAQGKYEGCLSGEWMVSAMSPSFYADHLASELGTLRTILDETNGERPMGHHSLSERGGADSTPKRNTG